jgi:hypothetical protein
MPIEIASPIPNRIIASLARPMSNLIEGIRR